MKSDPVRSAVKTSATAGTSVSATADMGGGTTRFGSAGSAAILAGTAANAAAPGTAPSSAAPAAAPFKKFRRLTTGFVCLAIRLHLGFGDVSSLYHMNLN